MACKARGLPIKKTKRQRNSALPRQSSQETSGEEDEVEEEGGSQSAMRDDEQHAREPVHLDLGSIPNQKDTKQAHDEEREARLMARESKRARPGGGVGVGGGN